MKVACSSARALRRALLDECSLQAIISLPQGVFVSKGGQGPKTSILYFVKGGQTRDVWFYKIANDGYTMGTNRKPIAGCQLVEALDLFHPYVREGKTPPETRHSFSIPAAWIKTLDPRVKDKIRTETRAEMKAREEEDRAKLTEKLAAQVAAKKLTATERKDKLAEHAEVWRSKTENAIAQKIERAHLCSFNLPNYRSSLTPAQVAVWQDFAATRVLENSPSRTLEEKYRALRAAEPDDIDPLLSALDPRHTLELDIARQFLTGLAPQVIAAHPHLRTLQEIIATQAITQRVTLGEVLKLRREVLPQDEYRGETDIIGKIRFADGKIFMRDERTAETNLQWTERDDLVISKINFHQGATTVNDAGRILASMDYLIYAVDRALAHPRFLFHLLRHPQFLAMLTTNKPGGVKGRSQPDFIEMQAIPLPPMDEQTSVVKELESKHEFIRGCAVVAKHFDLRFAGDPDWPTAKIGDVARINNGGVLTEFADDGKIACIKVSDMNLPENEWAIVTASHWTNDPPHAVVPSGSIVFPKRGASIATNKKRITRIPCVIDNNCMALIVTHKELLPEFLFFFLLGFDLASISKSAGIPLINNTDINPVQIPFPSLEIQKQVVAQLDAKLKLLAELRAMREEAARAIQQTLNRIWET